MVQIIHIHTHIIQQKTFNKPSASSKASVSAMLLGLKANNSKRSSYRLFWSKVGAKTFLNRIHQAVFWDIFGGRLIYVYTFYRF